MKKKWNCTQVEVEYVTESKEIFEQVLDEWAEIVYSYICQLHEDQSKASNLNAQKEQERMVSNG